MAQGVTITLMGLNSIGERSIIIHAKEDDFSDSACRHPAPVVACGGLYSQICVVKYSSMK